MKTLLLSLLRQLCSFCQPSRLGGQHSAKNSMLRVKQGFSQVSALNVSAALRIKIQDLPTTLAWSCSMSKIPVCVGSYTGYKTIAMGAAAPGLPL